MKIPLKTIYKGVRGKGEGEGLRGGGGGWGVIGIHYNSFVNIGNSCYGIYESFINLCHCFSRHTFDEWRHKFYITRNNLWGKKKRKRKSKKGGNICSTRATLPSPPPPPPQKIKVNKLTNKEK